MLTINRLDYDEAEQLIEKAREAALNLNIAMCIAVVDESGFLIAFQRMDGGKSLSTSLAQDKAFTAAISKRPTSDYNAIAVPGNLANGIQNACDGRFQIMAGGIPIKVNDQVIGAIGVSGGTPDQDEKCALAAAESFKTKV